MIANRYSLEREIGRGGMGAVWLGRDEVLGRPVAIKRIGRAPGADADSETNQQRAEREARIAASLSHRHVVAVFDLVVEDDHQWLVMEYVEGRSLAQTVREDGPLTHAQAAAVLADTAGALATAHAEGVVHRDVKPSNILLTRAGEAKLLDFGIARAQGDLTLTQSGMVSGSPAYLAPEVASGRPATTASDVWSLGATLYHLLSGHPPYDVGDNIVGGLYRIVHQEPPRLDDAGWLAPLLAATMTRDPDQRWTMSRVVGFLEAGPPTGSPAAVGVPAADASSTRVGLPAAPPVLPRPGRTRSSGGRGTGPRRALPFLLLVLLAVVAVLLVALLRDRQPPDATPATGGDTTPSSPSQSPSRSTSPSPPRTSSPTSEPTPRPSRSPGPSTAATPTAQGVRAFISDYLTTAAADPAQGFTMLTPAFQQASGGISGYRGFWDRVESIESLDISEVDVDGPGVGYTYRYRTTEGRELTDSVRLGLSYDAAQDRYRIADEG